MAYDRPGEVVEVDRNLNRVNGGLSKQQSSVSLALEFCVKELDVLEQAVQHFSVRLQTVLRDASPATQEKVTEDQASCVLARGIEQQALRLKSLRRAIDDMLNRLEL